MGALKASLAAAALAAVAAAPAGAQFSDREYRYGPAVTNLSGVLTKEDVSVPAGDGEDGGRESIFLLKLDRSIIVIGDATHDFNSRTEEVSEIQLTRSSPKLEFAPLVGKRAAATGQLFHRHSAYHRAKVLMMVEKIEAE